MTKKKIAIYGGAFDPIHIGHVAVANYVLENTSIEEIWIMPCYTHPFSKKMTSFGDRIRMCELAIKENLKIKVSDFEYVNRHEGNTFSLLMKIFSAYSPLDYEFFLIIGQDEANMIKEWVNYHILIQIIPFIIVPRKGVTLIGDWFLKEPHIFLDKVTNIPEISSTLVRNSLGMYYDSTQNYVDPQVLDYIVKEGLYDEYF
jgi:nicotinate-nucleotide adenylyltransferase